MMPARIGRRSFIAGSLALAAACGRGRRRGDAEPAGSIAVANYPFYVDAGTNPGFTRATGIRVEYHEEIGDEEAWFAGFAARREANEPSGRDALVVSDWLAARLRDRGWVVTHDEDGVPVADPIWAQGMTGVAYDRDAVGADVTRVADLFTEALHGRVALPDEARTVLGMALLADRVDPSVVTLDELAATAALLANSVRIGQVAVVPRAKAAAQLRTGEVAAAVVRASDVVGFLGERRALRFVVPDEGGLLHTDVLVVTSDAANPSGAGSYLEYVTEPANAAPRFQALPVLWDAEAITEQLRRSAPSVVDDPLRNPPADVRARLRPFRILDREGDQRLAELFAVVRGTAR